MPAGAIDVDRNGSLRVRRVSRRTDEQSSTADRVHAEPIVLPLGAASSATRIDRYAPVGLGVDDRARLSQPTDEHSILGRHRILESQRARRGGHSISRARVCEIGHNKRQTMQRAYKLAVSLEVSIKLICASQGGLEVDFQQAVGLCHDVSRSHVEP